MKFFYLICLFCFSPTLQIHASTPKSVTCTQTQYKEEYIPGTKTNPGYVKSYEVDVEIPCGGTKAEKVKEDCTDGKIAGALLGGGVGGAVSRKEGRWWAVPLGAVTGATIGAKVDGC